MTMLIVKSSLRLAGRVDPRHDWSNSTLST
jgi:hypothetical protein